MMNQAYHEPSKGHLYLFEKEWACESSQGIFVTSTDWFQLCRRCIQDIYICSRRRSDYHCGAFSSKICSHQGHCSLDNPSELKHGFTGIYVFFPWHLAVCHGGVTGLYILYNT